jgi:dihydroorotate dehydrogenase (NAD+) catalytic subunit
MAIDINVRKPVFQNTSAGLSGPAIRPIALRMVWELWETVHAVSSAHAASAAQVPIVGMGGIASSQDALEFLLAGASAIQVGSATFAHPPAMNEIVAGIAEYMKQKGFNTMGELSIRNI